MTFRLWPAGTIVKHLWMAMPVTMILSMITGAIASMYLLHWAVVLTAVIVQVIGLIVLIVSILHGSTSAWLTRLAAWIDGGRAVRMLDMDCRETFTIVFPMPNSNSWSGPTFWGTNVGEVILLPNGYVDRDCNSSYVHVWQPLNKQWATELALIYPEFPNWQEWKKLPMRERYELKNLHSSGQAHP